MKCLEFIYFYLMDETPTLTQPGETHSLPSSPVSTQPNTPFRSHETKLFARPVSDVSNISFASSSTSSSGSGTYSSSSFSTSSFSSSTTTSSVGSIQAPSPIKKSYSISTFTSPDLHTPPSLPPPIASGASKIPAHLQPRTMLMLRREVDYEPLSPRKPRAFRPGLRVTDTPGPATPSLSRLRETSNKSISSGCAEGAEERSSRSERMRTTDEKKEMLGSMLGNVDALVEGVRKAGIWELG